MSSLNRLAGELLIDHRASPGTREVPEGKVFEGPTYVCSHCQFVVIMRAERTRPREVCMRCMAIVCDACAALQICTPYIARYTDRPNVIISTAGAPARTTPSASGLLLPGHYSQ